MDDPFDPDLLRSIQDRLAQIDGLHARRIVALQTTPSPRSPAARDLDLPDGRLVRIYAGHTSFNALDHLLTWRILSHSALMPVLGHLSLLRAAIENADRCRWHVDPKLRPGKRVGRAVAARKDDQGHRRVFDEAKGSGPRGQLGPKGKTAAQRLLDLDASDESRRLAGIEEAGFGDPTSVTMAFGHDRWYRLTSGVVHGKEWSLPLVARMDPSSRVVLGPGTRAGSFTVSETFTADLTHIAVQAAENMIRTMERYFGGPA